MQPAIGAWLRHVAAIAWHCRCCIKASGALAAQHMLTDGLQLCGMVFVANGACSCSSVPKALFPHTPFKSTEDARPQVHQWSAVAGEALGGMVGCARRRVAAKSFALLPGECADMIQHQKTRCQRQRRYLSRTPSLIISSMMRWGCGDASATGMFASASSKLGSVPSSSSSSCGKAAESIGGVKNKVS